MGWLQGLRYQNYRQLQDSLLEAKSKQVTSFEAEVFHNEHIESQEEQDQNVNYEVANDESQGRQQNHVNPGERTFYDNSTADDKLPFITKEEVTSKKPQTQTEPNEETASEDKDLWIVIDNFVYDCSEFVNDHPGGQQVIKSFVGEDCSWQFWRFHGQKEMVQYGNALRIGRTAGVPNRFKETPRYVGLSKIGSDEW